LHRRAACQEIDAVVAAVSEIQFDSRQQNPAKLSSIGSSPLIGASIAFFQIGQKSRETFCQ